jgi:hypothetical protein
MAWRHLPAPYHALAAGCLNCGRSNLGWSPNTRVRPGGGHLPTSSLAMPSNTRFPLPGISLGSTRSRQEVGGRNRRSGGAHHFRGAGRSMRNKWASARQSASGVPRHNASEFRRPRCRASQNAGGRIAGRNAWRANSGRAESGASDRSKPPHSRRSSLGTGPPRDHWDGTVGGILDGTETPDSRCRFRTVFQESEPTCAGRISRLGNAGAIDATSTSRGFSSFFPTLEQFLGAKLDSSGKPLPDYKQDSATRFRSSKCRIPFVVTNSQPEESPPSDLARGSRNEAAESDLGLFDPLLAQPIAFRASN